MGLTKAGGMKFGGICSWEKQQALLSVKIYLNGKAETPKKEYMEQINYLLLKKSCYKAKPV